MSETSVVVTHVPIDPTPVVILVGLVNLEFMAISQQAVHNVFSQMGGDCTGIGTLIGRGGRGEIGETQSMVHIEELATPSQQPSTSVPQIEEGIQSAETSFVRRPTKQKFDAVGWKSS